MNEKFDLLHFFCQEEIKGWTIGEIWWIEFHYLDNFFQLINENRDQFVSQCFFQSKFEFKSFFSWIERNNGFHFHQSFFLHSIRIGQKWIQNTSSILFRNFSNIIIFSHPNVMITIFVGVGSSKIIT